MAVLLTTSLGDIVIDLFTDKCPLACKNFLKLCKIKYYNNCLFHEVQKDFIAQTGDPTGTGRGGDSIYKFLYGDQARYFDDEIHLNIKHDKVGVVAMANAGVKNSNASQFYFTLRESLDSLDGKHTIFGEVAEGLEVLTRINDAYVDEKNRPWKNIRIKRTSVLDDPYDDPPGQAELIPDRSPEFKPEEGQDVRLEDDWVPMDEEKDPEEVDKIIREREAHSRAVVLEMIGDIPEAEMKPPENVLFVCKLNPVTQDEDLELIFSRFGKVISAEIIRDHKTGESLCYGFVEFENQESCEAAYLKMNDVLIDDRRIHVDFSQSVAKLWNRYHRFGVKDDKEGVEKTKELPTKARYQLKDTDGQRGGTGRNYDMVFDHDEANGRRSSRREERDRRPRDERDRHQKSRDDRDDRRRSDADRDRRDEPRTEEPRRDERERHSRYQDSSLRKRDRDSERSRDHDRDRSRSERDYDRAERRSRRD